MRDGGRRERKRGTERERESERARGWGVDGWMERYINVKNVYIHKYKRK